MTSYADLLGIFKAKAASGKCPWCEANDWQGFGNDHFAAVMLTDSEGLSRKEGAEAFIAACKNCGYTQLHLTSLLEKGLEHP